MFISSPRKNIANSFNIYLNGSLLEETESIKYLGIYIDKHLTWKEHISIIGKKISKNIGIISKLRHYVDIDTTRVVYYSLIYAYLQYGAITWGNTHTTRLNPFGCPKQQSYQINEFLALSSPCSTHIQITSYFTTQRHRIYTNSYIYVRLL